MGSPNRQIVTSPANALSAARVAPPFGLYCVMQLQVSIAQGLGVH